MSKLGCKCGHVISNSVYPSPTEGTISRQEDEQALDTASERVAEFCAAVVSGKRNEWIASYFQPPYPTDIPDESVVYDIIQNRLQPKQIKVCECSQCGRLWVQKAPDGNRYFSFAPDDPGYQAVLGINIAKE